MTLLENKFGIDLAQVSWTSLKSVEDSEFNGWVHFIFGKKVIFLIIVNGHNDMLTYSLRFPWFNLVVLTWIANITGRACKERIKCLILNCNEAQFKWKHYWYWRIVMNHTSWLLCKNRKTALTSYTLHMGPTRTI